MGILSALSRKTISIQEIIEQAGFYLSPQIKVLEERNESYEQLLGQEAIYYMLCVTQEVASRDINEEEFGMLLIYLMGKERAYTLIKTYLLTKEHKMVHNKFINDLRPIAISDIKNGMIASSNFLIEHFEAGQQAAQDIYNSQ